MLDLPVMRTLIKNLKRLPGVGEKTAARLVYYIIQEDDHYARSLGEAIIEAKRSIKRCEQCFDFCVSARCSVCSNPNRSPELICVVEKPQDVWVIESTGTYQGTYHVLHGLISPIHGKGPNELTIDHLLKRTEPIGRGEIILALNYGTEGEATSLYLEQLMKERGFSISRLASGIPVGADLEFTDQRTLSKALAERRQC